MSDSPFSPETEFEHGVAMPLSPFVRRLVAENPSPLTFRGTNVYILGRGEVGVIDPGPDDEKHFETLRKALAGERVSHVIITHSHRDHCGLARRLARESGAMLCAYGPVDGPRGAWCAGRGARPYDKFADNEIRPDMVLRDGDVIEGLGWSLTAIHTPGHAPDHLCYALPADRSLFCGDHAMAWSTSLVAPPEGDMGQYIAGLEMLLRRDAELFLPGHGGRVPHPRRLIRALLAHRKWREGGVAEQLQGGLRTAPEMVAPLYGDIDEDTIPQASLSVLAHLHHLVAKGRARHVGGEGLEAVFEPA
jgi:glyoxylase-like metal-dependent hydrolase (beta-lactamase superfamily II)